MRTQQVVFNRLKKEKTELATHEVNLSAISTLESFLDEFAEIKREARKKGNDIKELNSQIAKTYLKLHDAKKSFDKEDKRFFSLWKKTMDQAKELEANEVIKKLESMAKWRDRYQGDIMTIIAENR